MTTMTPTHRASTTPTPAGARLTTSARIRQTLDLVQQHVPIARRLVRAGDGIFSAGDRLDHLVLVHSGFFKTTILSADGREQVVGLHFKGDWLGFDGIADGVYGSDAVAMDTGEIWLVRYDALLAACAAQPALMGLVHAAMSREIVRDRDSLMALCTLPADARVADFLRNWADALEQRGLRSDQITLRMSRAEIGNYLGMTLETVSRALSRLADHKVIGFRDAGRRDLHIPDLDALASFVQRRATPESRTLQ